MKKIVLFWIICISYIVSCNCFAQDVSITNNPTQQQPEVKTIFSFEKELGLTEDQKNKIKAMLFDTQQILGTSRKKVETLSTDLNRMIKNKEKVEAIRKKLEEIFKIQTDSLCVDIENGRKVENILSAEQLKKWNNIKEKEAGAGK
jgi:hypothetical protein